MLGKREAATVVPTMAAASVEVKAKAVVITAAGIAAIAWLAGWLAGRWAGWGGGGQAGGQQVDWLVDGW